ncbi:MAG TPA: ABC transporter permease [Planctomycetota bacterium]|nr:ABC transporter permease [Planctomycetota bacterium]
MDSRAWRTLLRHRGAVVGLALLLAFVIGSVVVPLLSAHDPTRYGEAFRGPSGQHLLGTDHFGRDIFVRLFLAARLSLLTGMACVAFAALIGVPLGAAAGYAGGWTDLAVSRAIDVLLAFPSILLAIAIAAVMGAGLDAVIIAVGVVGIPQFARQARAGVIELREREFVSAARALGSGHARILFRAILPNALGPLIVVATLGVGTSILTAAGLSYIGIGVQPGTPEWGAMLHEGFVNRAQSPWLAVFSGLAISLAVLAFNLFGDGLRDALDPRTK